MRSTQRRADAPVYPPGWLVGQLPVGMRDDDNLVKFTTIFERLGETLRAGADGIEHVVDPAVTTPGMLAALVNWLGYDLLDDAEAFGKHLPIERQRRIVRGLGHALPWRGTVTGLRLMLEAITGGEVEIDEPGGVVAKGETFENDGMVEVRLSSLGHLRVLKDRAHPVLEAFGRDEIPAHLGVRLVVTDREPASETP